MSKEYAWTLNVNGTDEPWKCVVTEEECITFEGDVETGRVRIENPVKKQGVLQIDGSVTVYGKACPFQLENGIPYVMIKGKWEMSETTFQDRQKKLLENQKITAIAQMIMGVVICLAVLAAYLLGFEIGNWWFCAIIGSMMGVVGGIQAYTLKKEHGM